MYHRLRIGEAKAAPRLVLPLVDRHDAAAEDLGDVGARVDAERQDRYQQLRHIDRAEDNKVDDQQLNHGRGAADDRQIHAADRVADLEFSRCIVRGADDRDDASDQDAQHNRRQSDQQGVPKTCQNIFPTVAFNEVQRELIGKFLKKVHVIHHLFRIKVNARGESAMRLFALIAKRGLQTPSGGFKENTPQKLSVCRMNRVIQHPFGGCKTIGQLFFNNNDLLSGSV